jgi:hypothetical protein
MHKLDTARRARVAGVGWSATAMDSRPVRPPLTLLAAHLRGDPPISSAAFGWSDQMKEFLRKARMNYAEVVVDSVVERMVPLGFRTAVDSDFTGDAEAARIFRANDLDLVCADLFGHQVGLGDGYGITAPPAGDGVSTITAESPLDVITADDPVTGLARAALKVRRDEWTGEEFIYVYLPGQIWVTRRKNASSNPSGMDWDPEMSGVLPTGFEDVVPVVRVSNRRGIGEFEGHLAVLDRINEGIFDRLVIGKHQAHRQRAVKGLPDEDEDGNRIDYTNMFTDDPGALWKVGSETDFWESQPIDLGPLRMAVLDDVKALAAATRTPLHWLTPDAVQGSAEGASLQRESATTKVEDRRRRGGRGLARLVALAFRFQGDAPRAEPSEIVTIWQSAERSTLAERFDAAVKAKASGMPWAAVAQHVLQLSPDDIARIEAQRADDLLFNAPQPAAAASVAVQPAAQPAQAVPDQPAA